MTNLELQNLNYQAVGEGEKLVKIMLEVTEKDGGGSWAFWVVME